MAPEELKEKIKIASGSVSKDRYNNILNRSINLGNQYNFPDGSINVLICMEELSELQKELSKYIRNKGNKLAITEEIADVYICIDKIKRIFNIDEESINKIINVKIDRMEERDNELIEQMNQQDDLSSKIQEETLRELEEEEL